MSVNPGLADRNTWTNCTEKIQELRELIDEEELDVDIQVDGGINDDTLETVMRAGANLMVAGSWVFKGDVAANVRHITEKSTISKKSWTENDRYNNNQRGQYPEWFCLDF